MKGVKHDSGKPRMELISERASEGLAKVLTFGARVYSADNWREGLAWRRVLGAALRHLAQFSQGNDLDVDSGLPHIDHAACCLMFLSEYQKTNNGLDDRFKMKLTGKNKLVTKLNTSSRELGKRKGKHNGA